MARAAARSEARAGRELNAAAGGRRAEPAQRVEAPEQRLGHEREVAVIAEAVQAQQRLLCPLDHLPIALVEDPGCLQVLDVPQELLTVERRESRPSVHVHPLPPAPRVTTFDVRCSARAGVNSETSGQVCSITRAAGAGPRSARDRRGRRARSATKPAAAIIAALSVVRDSGGMNTGRPSSSPAALGLAAQAAFAATPPLRMRLLGCCSRAARNEAAHAATRPRRAGTRRPGRGPAGDLVAGGDRGDRPRASRAAAPPS